MRSIKCSEAQKLYTKWKIHNMFYEIYGQFDLKRGAMMPKFVIKHKDKERKYSYLIEHFRQYEHNKHQSIVSFLNIILELENYPDYEVFLQLLLEVSQKVIKNQKVHSQCVLLLDFNHLLETLIKDKKEQSYVNCKVGLAARCFRANCGRRRGASVQRLTEGVDSG